MHDATQPQALSSVPKKRGSPSSHDTYLQAPVTITAPSPFNSRRPRMLTAAACSPIRHPLSYLTLRLSTRNGQGDAVGTGHGLG